MRYKWESNENMSIGCLNTDCCSGVASILQGIGMDIMVFGIITAIVGAAAYIIISIMFSEHKKQLIKDIH